VLDLMLQLGNVIHKAVQWMENGVPGHMTHALRPVVGEHREDPGYATIQFQKIMEGNVLELMLQPDNVIHTPVYSLEDGVPGHMEHVPRPVMGELREEPDHATILFQCMVERTVLDLVLQQGNVIHRPVHQCMEVGVRGHMEHVLRDVAEELREEPDGVTIQDH